MKNIHRKNLFIGDLNRYVRTCHIGFDSVQGGIEFGQRNKVDN